MNAPRSIGILLFDDVELLDFAGPLQVFSSLQSRYPDLIDLVETIGLTKSISVSKSLIKVECNNVLTSASQYDIVMIPGGMGTRPLIKNEAALSRIKTLCQQSKIITSVCTGSLVLAQLGLLSHRSATTHHSAYEHMKQIDPTITIDTDSRYIDHGDIILAQGVSAGIDMSLYLLEKFYSLEIKKNIRDYIEYHPEIQNY